MIVWPAREFRVFWPFLCPRSKTETLLSITQGLYHICRIGFSLDAISRRSLSSNCGTASKEIRSSLSNISLTIILQKPQELTPILSISPQSLASLAALHDLTLEETMRGLRIFFKREFGFKCALLVSRVAVCDAHISSYIQTRF